MSGTTPPHSKPGLLSRAKMGIMEKLGKGHDDQDEEHLSPRDVGIAPPEGDAVPSPGDASTVDSFSDSPSPSPLSSSGLASFMSPSGTMGGSLHGGALYGGSQHGGQGFFGSLKESASHSGLSQSLSQSFGNMSPGSGFLARVRRGAASIDLSRGGGNFKTGVHPKVLHNTSCTLAVPHFTEGPRSWIRSPADPRNVDPAFHTLETNEPVSSPLDGFRQLSEPPPHHPSSSIAGMLTATYPWVTPPGGGDDSDKVLLNDPNADAYFIEVGQNWMWGGLCDGSGHGWGAKWAAEVALAEARRQYMEWATKAASVPHMGTPNARDVGDMLRNAMVRSHLKLWELAETGSTTAALFCAFKAEPQGCKERIVFVYAIMGDSEIYHWSAEKSEWSTLVADPEPAVRLSASVTPGGLGKTWGDRQALPTKCNLHFGSRMCDPDDLILMASDGLGDTIDPVQMSKPESVGLMGCEDWIAFAQSRSSKEAVAQLAEIKMQNLQVAIPAEVCEEGPAAVLARAKDHAFEATSGERDMYNTPEYRQMTRFEKIAKFEQAKKEGLDVGQKSIWGKMDHVGMMCFRMCATDDWMLN
mmetsp:Transcript_22659/g.70363  ORF Transcript_22659/g.70363 Transcript_22659/m.70363 type:complete len:584 (-) Transcript_22659:442-2193(-)